MEKRAPIYELEGIADLSRDSVAQGSSFAAEKKKRFAYIKPHPDDFRRLSDERARDRLALEIYVQASLAREWLKQKDEARRLVARSRQPRLARASAGWISAVAATIGVFLAGVSIFLH